MPKIEVTKQPNNNKVWTNHGKEIDITSEFKTKPTEIRLSCDSCGDVRFFKLKGTKPVEVPICKCLSN